MTICNFVIFNDGDTPLVITDINEVVIVAIPIKSSFGYYVEFDNEVIIDADEYSRFYITNNGYFENSIDDNGDTIINNITNMSIYVFDEDELLLDIAGGHKNEEALIINHKKQITIAVGI